MSNYNRVLIPIDLALGTGGLTPAVRRLVDTRQSEITLLHVVEAQPWLGRNGQTMRLMTELELFAHQQFRGAQVSRRIEWGRPADCILRVIHSTRADVVLMSAGHASPGASALGPVAAEVLTNAPCPILLEWAAHAPVNWARTRPVCCAVELGTEDHSVLREAVRAAELLDAPLKAICALVPGVSRVALWDPVERERQIAAARSRVEAVCRRWAPQAEVHVDVGLPVTVLSRAVRFHGAGLLVTGGSPDNVLPAESACPVLYVSPAAQSRTGQFEASPALKFAAGRTA